MTTRLLLTRFFPARILLFGLSLFLLLACSPEPTIAHIDQNTLVERMQGGNAPLVIDMRTEKEYATGHVAGAINIPYSHLVKFLTEVPADKEDEVVLYCETGVLAEKAINLLRKGGWKKLYHLQGNMQEWRKAGLPTG